VEADRRPAGKAAKKPRSSCRGSKVRPTTTPSSGPRRGRRDDATPQHNFDQLRMTISGRTNYGPKRWIEPGEIAYFPEGVPYGPEECGGDRLGFTLQFGGASGNGIMTQRQVHAGREELARAGKFERGVYYPSPAGGKERPMDGYERFGSSPTNGRSSIRSRVTTNPS